VGDVEPCRRRGRLVLPALCAAALCVGPDSGDRHGPTVVRLTSSVVPAAAVPARSSPAAGRAEDLVPVPVDRPYVWPSGIGLVVAEPTSARGGAAPVVRVRTTVLNESPTPYDVRAMLGPSALYDGHAVDRITDSRYTAATAEHIVAPGRRLAYETTFPAGDGRLTLVYRADFRFEAVVVDA
jgi:hypothetical protein